MCVLLIAWDVHPLFKLLVAANRDELHARATAPLDAWADFPGVVAGRDLQAGGSWLAVDQHRFAAVTNYRDAQQSTQLTRSRGELVNQFMASAIAPDTFAAALSAHASNYLGFNFLFGDSNELWYASNRATEFAKRLIPGIYGLSNHLLGTGWPKINAGLQSLRTFVDTGEERTELLFQTLAEREQEMPTDLPWPASSGAFIAHQGFGTRASTVFTRDRGMHGVIEERRFGPMGKPIGQTKLQLAAQRA